MTGTAQSGYHNWRGQTLLSAVQAASDGSVEPVTVVSLEHEVLYANPAARLLAGDEPLKVPLSCHPALLGPGGCSQSMEDCAITQAKSSGQVVKNEFHTTDKAGQERHISITASPVYGATGDMLCIIESCRIVKIRQAKDETAITSAAFSADLHQVSALMAETSDNREIIEAVLAKVVKVTGAQAGMILLWDPFEEHLHIEATQGMTDELARAFASRPLDSDFDYIWHAAKSGEISLVSSESPAVGPGSVLAADAISSCLAAPLRVGNRIAGAVVAFTRPPASFSSEDIPLIQLLGLYAGSIIDSARSYAMHLAIEGELLSHERYLDCLAGISSQLLEAADPWAELPEIISWLAQTTNVSRCYYFECDETDDGNYVCSQRCEAVQSGIAPRLAEPEYQNMDMTAAGYQRWMRILAGGKELQGNVSSLPPQEQKLLTARGAKWLLVLPVVVRGQLAGFIGFDENNPDSRLGASEVSLLRSAANTISAALERVMTLQELQGTLTQLENILQYSTGYAIFATDGQLNIIRMNPLAEEITGHRQAEVAGSGITGLELFSPLGPDLLGEVREAVAERGGVWDKDITSTGNGAGVRTFNIVIAETSDKQGQRYGYTVYCRDVTEVREAERQLVDRQRMESVGLLAGGIAHDFNNILMGILGYASLVKDRVGTEHSAYRMASTIEQSAERAAALTRELLAYARGGKSESVHLYLDRQAEEILNMVSSSLPKKLEIQREYAKGLPPVLGDAAQLQQVVMNLCINAGDAIRQHAADIEDESYVGRITLRTSIRKLSRAMREARGLSLASADDMYVCFEVQDNGCGMDEDTRRRIFEPFFTTKLTGRGLGLAAVEGIIHNHGGILDVESYVGQGSRFTVLLPAAEGIVDEEPADELAEFGGTETVLVIDDEEVNRQLVLLTLTNIGHKVLLAASGSEGLTVFESSGEDISVVLLDLTMPGLSGENTMVQFLRRETGIPIILTSGFDEHTVMETPGAEHAAGFIQKPYTPEVLARAVRKVLDSKDHKP